MNGTKYVYEGFADDICTISLSRDTYKRKSFWLKRFTAKKLLGAKCKVVAHAYNICTVFLSRDTLQKQVLRILLQATA